MGNVDCLKIIEAAALRVAPNEEHTLPKPGFFDT
jgi:hypothetical protein